MDDQRLELVISYLLRTGVGLSAALVFTGGAIYLARHGTEMPDYRTFHSEPEAFRTLHGLLSWSVLSQGRGLIQLGLILLIFTPIARVALALAAFAAGRDWIYVVVSAIVLATLLYSFLSA